ncbi:hypothetical protein HHK36_000263 [Tetracentron sinense]|uniref:CASP-like protein n=1 Tax=Tetracentron sinense TaxID=13715 RepID=A0A834ZTT3_TETSI|nr:hypothetical protein HHK36_000263 [Tetracentron sinense]
MIMNSMGTDKDGVGIACGAMAGVSLVVGSPAQQHLPTPSPFTDSVTSTRWSSQPSIHLSNLLLRSLALLFSLISALSLAAPSSQNGDAPFSDYPELRYCFTVTILASIYSAFQLFKGVCDISHRGLLISDITSDYISFILDQMVGYLLMSSSSVTVLAIERDELAASLWKATMVAICMAFASFLVIAACTLLSGYKLCKRIIW